MRAMHQMVTGQLLLQIKNSTASIVQYISLLHCYLPQLTTQINLVSGLCIAPRCSVRAFADSIAATAFCNLWQMDKQMLSIGISSIFNANISECFASYSIIYLSLSTSRRSRLSKWLSSWGLLNLAISILGSKMGASNRQHARSCQIWI
jgi:hypothetical protein